MIVKILITDSFTKIYFYILKNMVDLLENIFVLKLKINKK